MRSAPGGRRIGEESDDLLRMGIPLDRPDAGGTMSTNVTGTGLVSRGFSDVDRSGQADEHAAYLERAATSVAAERERWLDRLDLDIGDVVLDAGSGIGEVALLLAGRVGPAGAISRRRGDAFLDDQDRRAAEGRFQITTLWYLVAARKPVTFQTGDDR
jgi:hypothetical protein